MNSQRFGMFIILLLTSVLISACSRVVVNSSENDELIASVANLPGRADFKAIVPTIISKCASCHTHQAWYGYAETDYFGAGLIIPGDYANSKLYYRLSTSTEGPGPKNMPQGGSAAFTESEITLLKTWITNYN